jgi:hypothetical protein
MQNILRSFRKLDDCSGHSWKGNFGFQEFSEKKVNPFDGMLRKKEFTNNREDADIFSLNR